jgi:hypothetical protein
MGLSETIVAAIIGAMATMVTAFIQLMRYRLDSEKRLAPKKNRTRSIFATVALMLGCIVGGYAWSALRAVSSKEELQTTMQAEFSRQFAEFAARQQPSAGPAATGATLAARLAPSGSSESLAQLPPCRIETHPDDVGPVSCTDRAAQPISLCAAIPAGAQALEVRVQARARNSQEPWVEREPGAAVLGSLHFAASTAEYPVNAELRSVCLGMSNWSVEEPYDVRLVVEYGPAKSQPVELTASTPANPTP